MKPLQANDVIFLWLEHRGQPMHVAGLQLYKTPENAGPDFAQRLVESYRRVTRAVPPFNQHAVFRYGHWFWEEDKDFELDYHVRHSALPRPGRIRDLLALVSRLHGSLLDRTRPLWELHVIEGLADGRIAIYTKVHHAMFDGVSAMKMLEGSLSEDPREIKPPIWALEQAKRRWYNAPEHFTLKSAFKLARQGISMAADIVPGLRSGMWDLIRSSQYNPIEATPFQAPPSIFNVPISGARRFAAQAYATERFKKLSAASGAKVNDIVLAVCAGSLRRYLMTQNALPEKPLIAMVPVSVRSADEDSSNAVVVMLANLATHIDNPVQRLNQIIQSTSQAKQKLSRMTRMQQFAHAAALTSPVALVSFIGFARKHPPFNIVISNVPGPKNKLYLNGLELDEIYPVSIPFDYLALNITINSYCNEMGFGYIACRRAVPSMQRLLDYNEESLQELEMAYGLLEPLDGTLLPASI
ncbi:MAG TPA: wax ester/triacylglycerol synthase family O-acyltransferase [Pseudomonadales bacterium]|nr:wax ester/triacylglycerol synthase family O-acyltransferase [Pseudomonadales bacterium]